MCYLCRFEVDQRSPHERRILPPLLDIAPYSSPRGLTLVSYVGSMTKHAITVHRRSIPSDIKTRHLSEKRLNR